MVYVEDTRPDVVVVDQPAVVAPVAPVAPAGSPHFWEHFSFLGPFIQFKCHPPIYWIAFINWR